MFFEIVSVSWKQQIHRTFLIDVVFVKVELSVKKDEMYLSYHLLSTNIKQDQFLFVWLKFNQGLLPLLYTNTHTHNLTVPTLYPSPTVSESQTCRWYLPFTSCSFTCTLSTVFGSGMRENELPIHQGTKTKIRYNKY